MGNCWSWLMGQRTGETTVKTPLLSGQRQTNKAPPFTSSHVPSYASQGQPEQEVVSCEPGAPRSVRQYRPPDPDDTGTPVSIGKLEDIKMKHVAVESLDKMFQDHAKLYNDVLKSCKTMKADLHDFKTIFVAETEGIPVLQSCVTCLVSRCGKAKLEVKRLKNCLKIFFDPQEVSKYCKDSSPEQTLEALTLFNRVNKHVQAVLNHAPPVDSSISIILKDERKLMNDILKADLEGSTGPNSMKACVENFKSLKRISTNLTVMTKDTDILLKSIIDASKAFFKDDET
ncbi:hypothetical protein ScPMuIL_006497 [Solemya velum]